LRRSFKRATPLHMSQVLCDLHKVWGRHLKSYAKKVLEQLCAPPPLEALRQALPLLARRRRRRSLPWSPVAARRRRSVTLVRVCP
jgi:hypothetical protein